MNRALSNWTTLRIGGPAERLVAPRSAADVRDVLADCARRGEPWRALGKGSNLLVADEGVPGCVIQTRELRDLEDHGGGRFRAGAGLPTSVLLAQARRRGYGGLEALVGYPATVGGAARMNAGGRWGETGARVVAVRVALPDGRLATWDHARCGFGYRDSALGAGIVVDVEFLLPSVDRTLYGERIAAIHRDKSAVQPLDEPSAGCVFKNPGPGVSAGALVDACGLLGRRVGGARVSTRHGNFIVNAGGATARDVHALVAEIREAVRTRHGVRLELEVECWGPEHVPAAH